MESQPQDPEFRNIPENFDPYHYAYHSYALDIYKQYRSG